MLVSGQLACPYIGEIRNVYHRIVCELRTWELLSTPAVPSIVKTQVVTSLPRYSSGRTETWQFEQISCALTPTFPFTVIGVAKTPAVKHLISLLGGTATFPFMAQDGRDLQFAG